MYFRAFKSYMQVDGSFSPTAKTIDMPDCTHAWKGKMSDDIEPINQLVVWYEIKISFDNLLGKLSSKNVQILFGSSFSNFEFVVFLHLL